jgi:hypothetical protein
MTKQPFVWVTGTPYLVVNYTLPPDDLPSLPKQLEALLTHQSAAAVLILRPLSRKERRIVEEMSGDANEEAWAHIIVKDVDRYRSR